MSDTNQQILVRNRSASIVAYKIPEDNIRRQFEPGEIKKLPKAELVKLAYQPGGRNLIANFLQVAEEELEELNIGTEPEYNMSVEQIDELIQTGSLDAFLDCLDFAPVGVIDLVKKRAVELPMNDMPKREALKNKTGFDVTTALRHVEEEKLAENSINASAAGAPERRVKVDAPAAGRRTTSNYKVVKKETTTE